MNRCWFALAAFLLLSFNCLSQPKRRDKLTHRPNKIDSVAILGASPDSILVWDILDTIRARRFPDWPRSEYPKRARYDPGLPHSVPADWVRIADSLGIRTITKADFDGDGRTDMICLAGGRSDLTANVILDDGANQYRVAPLDKTYQDIAFPVLHYDNDKAEILYYNFPTHDIDIGFAAFQGGPLVLQMDTLVYYKGAFVEKNLHPAAYRIAHIHFSEVCGYCPYRNPVFDLSIDSVGKAVYMSAKNMDSNGREMSFTAIIDQHTLDDIYGTLRYIDFPKLKDSYRLNGVDHGGCTTTITYDGGKTKNIDDDGSAGTHGLVLLYDQLAKLQLTQKWMKIDLPGK